MADDLFTARKSLAEICTVPEKIISVYSLEKHVWADSNSEASRKAREPERQTIEEFQIDPVRPFLTDILRLMAAPWKREPVLPRSPWLQITTWARQRAQWNKRTLLCIGFSCR